MTDREAGPPEDPVTGGDEATAPPAADAGASEEGAVGASVEADAGAGEAPPGRRSRRCRPFTLRCGLVAAVLAVIAGFTVYEAATWPDVGRLARENPKTTAFIERWRDQHPGRPVAWRWVPYGAISGDLKRAVLVGEDINFFSHHGFDTGQIKQAIEEAWEEKEAPRGASTLTQQLAKNLWLSPSRNPFRKLKEAVLTRQLEAKLGKRRILELYLNVVEFGPGVFGAEAAARTYYAEPASVLSPEEAAGLAAGLPKPSRWHPGSASRAYARRVRYPPGTHGEGRVPAPVDLTAGPRGQYTKGMNRFECRAHSSYSAP